MRKMLLIAAAAALLAPAAALATKPPTKPSHPTQSQSGSHPAKVMYILRGTVTAYTSGASITINLTSSNRHGKALESYSPLQFTSLTGTKVVLHKHADIAINDRVVIKVRYAKKFDPLTDPGLFVASPVQQIVDQGKQTKSGQGQSGSHSSTFLYVLHGTLVNYGSGLITVNVTRANHARSLLETNPATQLTFAVGASTKVGPAKASWQTDDRVIVKVSGPKIIAAVADLTPAISPYTTAKQVIDQGQ